MMKCSQCEEKLFKYIEGSLSEEEEKIVKNHILVCHSCNEVYNKELLENEAFKEAFSADDIKFNNIAPKVMNAIDHNKYNSIKKSNMKKSANKRYIRAMVAALFLCVFVSPFIMDYINRGDKNKDVSLNVPDKSSFMRSIPNEDSKARDIDKIESDNNDISSNINYVDVYTKKDMGSNNTIDFNEKYSILKKGEQFEAILPSDNTNRAIYIKDNLNNIYEFKVRNEECSEIPVFIEWYDSSNLIVIQGSSSESNVNGSSIVVINVDTNIQMLIADSKNENVKFKKVEKVEDGLKIYFTEYINGNSDNFREWVKVYENYQLGDVIHEFN